MSQEWGSLCSETLHSGMPRALMPDDGPGGEAEVVVRHFGPFSSGRKTVVRGPVGPSAQVAKGRGAVL